MGMTNLQPNLEGKVALVSGASRGIGKALALALASRGCAVSVLAKSEQERENLPGTIHQTVAEIETAGGRGLAIKCNVRHAEEVELAVSRTHEEFGRIDFVVNNAGALWMKPLVQTPLKKFDLLVDVNVRGPFALARLAAEHMMVQGDGGHILNIAPPVDLALLPGRTPYLITKYGMAMLAHGLAGELAPHKIAANNLWPATAVESQATINHQLGTRENWRTPAILCDAMLALFGHNKGEISGRDLVDEDWLRECGVEDFSVYSCVPGGRPLYIHGPKAVAAWEAMGGAGK